MNAKGLLSEYKKLIDRELDRRLPRRGKLAQALRYSLFAGGKRFRPALCLATAKALGGQLKQVLAYACAVEMIHTFTLIHDDLPVMDNADLRRGKPTCHKVFGEALAVLAGDALNTLAFTAIADHPAAARELGDALYLVVEGQVADINSAGEKMSLKRLQAIHAWKTGALLKACVRGSGLICGAGLAALRDLTSYAEHLGLAFQITDDILDVTATRRELGKPVGADVKKGFPYVVGLERSRAMAAEETHRATKALLKFDRRAAELRSIAEYVLSRQS